MAWTEKRGRACGMEENYGGKEELPQPSLSPYVNSFELTLESEDGLVDDGVTPVTEATSQPRRLFLGVTVAAEGATGVAHEPRVRQHARARGTSESESPSSFRDLSLLASLYSYFPFLFHSSFTFHFIFHIFLSLIPYFFIQFLLLSFHFFSFIFLFSFFLIFFLL